MAARRIRGLHALKINNHICSSVAFAQFMLLHTVKHNGNQGNCMKKKIQGTSTYYCRRENFLSRFMAVHDMSLAAGKECGVLPPRSGRGRMAALSTRLERKGTSRFYRRKVYSMRKAYQLYIYMSS